jgi:outer membrane receptor protein involved in Fe transport
MTTRKTSFALATAALLFSGSARAQDVALPEPVAQPSQPKEGEPEIALDADREIDLANVVTSAAKGVTTVQEAPAIITIITSDDIKARGFRFITDALATVPGWITVGAVGQQVPGVALVRGVPQSSLLLHDGISLFDPFGNVPNLQNNLPVESIKRIEVVTGPGGVLWGANSYLGIVNVIGKDAEDVNGLEVNAGYGDGPGYRQWFKGYALFGKTFFSGKLKIFQHASYENWIGPTWNIPQFQASTSAPQPTGTAFFGPTTEPYPARSWMVTIDGKISLGPVSLSYQIPFAQGHQQLVFANSVNPLTNVTMIDRFVVLEYKDRFLKDLFGLTAKGYWTQFVRNFDTQLFPAFSNLPPFSGPLGMNPGGLHFEFGKQYDSITQRAGVTLDTDFNLKYGFKVLLGGEFFYEGIQNNNESFSSAAYAADPTNLTAMGGPNMSMGPNGLPLATATPGGFPFLCPQTQQANGTFLYVPQCPKPFISDQYRLVGALYADLQYRPFSKVTLDGGVRVQKAFGGRPYDWTPLYSGAIVYNFLPDYHLKLNYTTGFRAPVFNATDAVAGGILYGATPNLRNENSQSFQGELNARLLRNVRKVRELELRLDYSYTVLTNVVLLRQGFYVNAGTRAIQSVEAYGKLYLSGDHFLTASYTFLYAQSTDQGVLRNTPNHWVSLGASFNLVKNMLDVNANLLITGAYEDPNRVPNATNPLPGSTTAAQTTDLAFDRLTPVALLQLGFRLRFLHEKLGFSGQFYNVLNQRYYYVDPFYDLTPSVELWPTPAPGFSFFAQASYHF